MNIKNIMLVIFLSMNSIILGNMPEENNSQSMTEEVLTCLSNAGHVVYKFGEKLWGFAEAQGRAQESIKLVDKQHEQIMQKDEIIKEFAKNLSSNQAGPEKITEAIHQNTETHKETNEILKDGLDKFESIEKAVKVAGLVYTTASIVKDSYYLYKFFFPTEDPEIKKAEARSRLKILKTQETLDELNECLVRNVDGAKDNEGMPILCNNLSQLYAAAAGYKALRQIKKDFNER